MGIWDGWASRYLSRLNGVQKRPSQAPLGNINAVDCRQRASKSSDKLPCQPGASNGIFLPRRCKRVFSFILLARKIAVEVHKQSWPCACSLYILLWEKVPGHLFALAQSSTPCGAAIKATLAAYLSRAFSFTQSFCLAVCTLLLYPFRLIAAKSEHPMDDDTSPCLGDGSSIARDAVERRGGRVVTWDHVL